jgi:hypothetical protein
MTIAGSIGAMSGPALSGYLSEPEGRIPFFGDLKLFQNKPYLLPGLTLSFMAVLASLAVYIWVPEVSHAASNSLTKPDQLDSPSPIRR